MEGREGLVFGKGHARASDEGVAKTRESMAWIKDFLSSKRKDIIETLVTSSMYKQGPVVRLNRQHNILSYGRTR